MNKNRSWLKNRLKNFKFSSINDEDKKLLVDEFDKIRHVIDVYLLDKSKDPEKIAKYKYERELKFKNNTNNEDNTNNKDIINEKDQKLLNDEFRKIRELIDKYLLGTKPNIEEIFNKYNSLENNDILKDMKSMDEKDKKLLNDLFHQISHVISNHLLDIPKDEEIFNKYKETVETSSFSTEMNDGDKKLLVDEFNRIKHVINSLFNERKILGLFEYIEERELHFSNNMNENDKKLLNDKFCEIKEIIDNFLLNEPRIQTNVNFSEKMDSKDKELLTSYINNSNNVIHNIRNDIDNYILNKV
ncbi:unnamed protein product [Rhizophagus irregularis]|nr:unnamed protein product [Rhizophagus irregularis]